MSDIIDDLLDLHKQATTERSHYYVAQCCQRAIEEIARLRKTAEECPVLTLLAALKVAREYIAKIDGTMAFTTPENRLTANDLAMADAAIAAAKRSGLT